MITYHYPKRPMNYRLQTTIFDGLTLEVLKDEGFFPIASIEPYGTGFGATFRTQTRQVYARNGMTLETFLPLTVDFYNRFERKFSKQIGKATDVLSLFA